MAGEGDIGQAGGLASLRMGKALAFAVEDQLGIVDEIHAVGVGEIFSTGPYEIDVGALFEHQARGLDGIAQPLDAGNATGFHAARRP